MILPVGLFFLSGTVVCSLAAVFLTVLVLRFRFKRDQKRDEPDAKVSVRKQTFVGDRSLAKKLKTPKRRETGRFGELEISKIMVYYATEYGKTKTLAEKITCYEFDNKVDVTVLDISTVEPEESLNRDSNGTNTMTLFLFPTVADGKPPVSGIWFCKWLNEAANDFRVEKAAYSHLQYAVFGLGNSQYKNDFNLVAKNIDSDLLNLGANRVLPVRLGDEDTSESSYGGIENDFNDWLKRVNNALKHTNISIEHPVENGINFESSDEEEANVVDVEDLVKPKSKITTDQKEMITAPLRQVLTKQGYKLIGSHSGVKLCRWTKAMLRGRGGCYKHTFYGIESHRCMEATPSLACANKCVFCWRHHSNPVGTEWKWKMDNAEDILKGALENHYNMIKEFRGVPGVIPERYKEGLKAKHCALSLVGEPIMYPEICKFVKLLHSKEISTFLVTNAQFPDAIKALDPVTQLYVSVDASTKESLKKIDRPLFKDFWERFIESLKALSSKGQRTVYRLTLVKAWNFDEMKDYASLVSLGNPDFIEIKGVTYCGGGEAGKPNTLTMANIPWHSEVTSFVKQLVSLLPDYEIASEHEHSNCLLIAHKKFKLNGEWYTWIDYDKFHELIQKFYETDGSKTFTALDYLKKTPPWAVFGCAEQGFDPVETRWHRKNNTKDVSGC
ncbi:S-adenosyl-L-methionine-dependent tRNA 4-demethylwyosine synthase-like [Cimex lectularius]|uniref:S-adenosyl-L-methionine-dependent tRNA 4-demethylwyosine synthase TYW1 n=1 Tax=Cimex lectularius TaxID=79782 RepID=A0A8I6TBF4_CIMLE|nr:S-adenosyl-L-methionine-dependent tRNA 4-demethylwyosine synthase-like [Cimex lectularius]